MADVIKYIEIIQQAAALIKKECNCKVYADEVLENFNKPCFFIKLASINSPQTVNFTEKTVTLVLTYFPADDMRDELHYMDIFDRVERLFQHGLQLSQRFLHTSSIDADRVGEERDILQITVDFEYLDRVIIHKPAVEMMEELEMQIKVNEREVLQ